jgi:hypothetical protein
MHCLRLQQRPDRTQGRIDQTGFWLVTRPDVSATIAA